MKQKMELVIIIIIIQISFNLVISLYQYNELSIGDNCSFKN